MVRETLAIPATGASVALAFSLSGRVVTGIRSQSSLKIIITDIIKYKNRVSRRKYFDNAVMSLVEEEAELELDPEELSEWISGWWNSKRNDVERGSIYNSV